MSSFLGLLAGTLQPIRVVNYASSQSEAQEESKGQSGSSVAQRVTRVWTQRIELTSDVNEYLECVDEKLLAIVLCKGVRTCCMHNSCIWFCNTHIDVC
jgi:hypothetical protein